MYLFTSMINHTFFLLLGIPKIVETDPNQPRVVESGRLLPEVHPSQNGRGRKIHLPLQKSQGQ